MNTSNNFVNNYMNTSAFIIVFFIILLTLAALAHKLELMSFKPSFGLFAVSLLMISIATIVVLVKLLMSLSSPMDQRLPVALLLGALPTLLLLYYVILGVNTPRIHDVSTRYSPIVAFTHAQTLRSDLDNTLVNNNKNQQIQQQAYSQLKSLHLDIAPDKAFALALKSAESLGWVITHNDGNNRGFEAVDTTALFGFKDDIRVEVLPNGSQGSSVDARSVSRVGQSDFGVNAKRIGKLFELVSKNIR